MLKIQDLMRRGYFAPYGTRANHEQYTPPNIARVTWLYRADRRYLIASIFYEQNDKLGSLGNIVR